MTETTQNTLRPFSRTVGLVSITNLHSSAAAGLYSIQRYGLISGYIETPSTAAMTANAKGVES
jgi:hypothetical protein